MIYFLQYDFGLATNVGVFVLQSKTLSICLGGTLFNMQTLSP
jgi:hypothetical protein